MSLFEELSWRGVVHSFTDGADKALSGDAPITGYIGFDPTASSLHVGSLLQIMNLARLQRFGHHAIALVGGGTGMIGDPSGKSQERQLLTVEQIQENLAGIRGQLEQFLDFEGVSNPARMVDNGEWLLEVKLIDFLRDIGKHFRVNVMMTKDSVRERFKQEQGISFTEFSYQLLQGYDYLVLHDRYGCTLQMGGSDQFGNIIEGTDLIRTKRGAQAFGVVSPLVTKADGTKFGKSEGGQNIWLDPARTSPFKFYQFWINTLDADVINYLKYFTFLSREDIAGLEQATQTDPGQKVAQKRLAAEVTRLVHGESALERAMRASQVLFGGSLDDVPTEDLLDIFGDAPSSQFDKSRFDGEGVALADVLVESGLLKSKREARDLMTSGGVYVNNVRVSDPAQRLTHADSIGGQVIVLRKGGKTYHLARLG
ncbi:MAG: tyrosine--tRNA ligase [Anaerolineae bacterium]|nr:tyrosine--tRNA ligase [Anaerolineae bacterium]